MIKLPKYIPNNRFTLEHALMNRRSNREYIDEPLELDHIARLLWAAQGINDRGKRTTPSAGGLYPLEIYLFAKSVKNLDSCIYRYIPKEHALKPLVKDYSSEKLWKASKQDFLLHAPAIIFISAVFGRTWTKYKRRGNRYVLMEAGCAAQNIALQATILGLGSVFVGAFRDRRIREMFDDVFEMTDGETPLVIMPIGKI